MRRPAQAILLLLAILPFSPLAAQPLKLAPHRTGQILIKPRIGASSALLQALHSTHGATTARTFARLGNLQVLRLPKGLNVEQAVALYRFNPLIEFAEPDYRFTINQTQTFPNDPSFNQLWGLHNTGQSGGKVNGDINAPEAWTLRTNANTVVVGVVDSGIDYNHPDLAANMWTNPAEIPNNGLDDDNNGYVDDVYGINAITNGGNPMDDNNHGTHVAGTIGAVGNNGIGVTGVAWNVKLMALKFLSADGSGSAADAIECINYSLTKGVHILNNSWGGGGFSQSLFNAINSAKDQGVIFVAAASNEGSNNDQSVSYPSGFNLPNVVAVAATDRNDLLASYSNYGYRSVHLGAPGSSILSTTPNNNYSTFSGTSMATPQVSGALALLKAQFPSLTYDELIRRLLLATDPLPALETTTFTGGRLNLYRALTSAQRPIPHLTVSARSGNPPLTVNFTDTSIGPIISRQLNVGVGGSAIALNGSTSHTYTSSGTYTATLSVSGPDGSASRTQVIRVQPAYTVVNDTYRWIDTTGMASISLSDDGVSSPITLPFAFPFYGDQFQTAYISANGFLTLGSANGASQFENTTLPSVSAPNNALYAYWDDLDPGSGGTIRYGASAGSFVVSWENIPHFSAANRLFSFQMVFNRWGGIQYNYREVQPSIAVFGGGRSATVGIEDDSGVMATLSSFNAIALINLTARRFGRGSVNLNAASGSAPAAGGTGTITVTPTDPAFTAWTVSGQPDWLTVDLSANPHTWTAAANPDANSRTATLAIGDKTYTVTQSGSPGTVSINPTSATAPAGGGTGSITVTPTPSTYTSWTVTGQPSWLAISITGPTVSWTAAANNSVSSRSATLTIGDQTFTLNQSGATGSVSLGASSTTAAAAGASGSVTVTPTPPDYTAWTVTGQTTWLTAAKSGNAVAWTAAANNSVSSRGATLTIGGNAFTVNQSGATGTVTLGAASATAPAAGGSGSVTVTPTPSDFTSWTVSTPPAWLSITRNLSSVSWSALANDSVNSRSATLTIADKSYTVTQSGATGSLTLSAASATAPAAGGSGSVTVTPSPSDFTTWSVSAPPAWLTITRSNNTISWTAQANNSVAPRAATLTIGDKTYSVNQSGAAGSVSLSPASATAPATGASGSITVTPTPSDYNTWTVSGNPSWLSITATNNTLAWTAQANNSVNARSANVTIGDKTFTLAQSGATGTLALSVPSATAPAAGASGSVTVTPTPADYTSWTVTGQPDWLTITVSANVVSWTAAPRNSVNSRTANLTIGTQTFSVTQSGAVGSVALSLSTASLPPAGGTGSLAVTPTPTDYTAWAVTGTPAWLTVTTTGTTVSWSAPAINSVNPRTATLSIGGQSVTITQAGAPGAITLSAATATVGDIGGSGSITLTPTPADYSAWTVTGAPQWLIVTTTANTVSWTAAANNSVTPRNAVLTIDDKTFTLNQSGAPGTLTLSPASASAPAAGVTGTINVTPTPDDFKSWTVAGQPAWLTTSITGNIVTWTAAPNPSVAPRTATLSIGDKAFSLTQSGVAGSVTLSPPAATAPAAGATGSITVTPTPTDYTTWTISGQPAWLTLSGSGNTISWTATANPSVNPRSATVTIGDKTFALTQSGAIGSVTLTPPAATAPATGATGSITVTPTPTDFTTWTISGQPAWLTLSASGNSITWTAAPNPSVTPRSATVTIGDKTFGLTQAAAQPPAQPSATDSGPIAGSGASQTLTFQFSHPQGFTQLGVLNVLINTALNGGNACYVAYSQPAGVLFLVNDGGPDAGLSAPLTLGSAATVQNSQCTVHGTGSSAQGSGNTLTLTLRLTFAPTFTGSKVIYTAARDTGTGNTGWKTLGASQIPEFSPALPRTDPLSPATITAAAQTVSATYRSATGITTAWLLINSAVNAGQACYVAYFAPGNLLLLYPDNGDGANALTMPLTGTNAVENSQCRISAQGSSATTAGGVLTLNLNITTKSPLAGPNGIWTALQTTDSQVSPWRISGNWLVP
jgi:subtilisin family serine protease